MTEALQSATRDLRWARNGLRWARTDFERAVAKTALWHAIEAVRKEMPVRGAMFFRKQA